MMWPNVKRIYYRLLPPKIKNIHSMTWESHHLHFSCESESNMKSESNPELSTTTSNKKWNFNINRRQKMKQCFLKAGRRKEVGSGRGKEEEKSFRKSKHIFYRPQNKKTRQILLKFKKLFLIKKKKKENNMQKMTSKIFFYFFTEKKKIGEEGCCV